MVKSRASHFWWNPTVCTSLLCGAPFPSDSCWLNPKITGWIAIWSKLSTRHIWWKVFFLIRQFTLNCKSFNLNLFVASLKSTILLMFPCLFAFGSLKFPNVAAILRFFTPFVDVLLVIPELPVQRQDLPPNNAMRTALSEAEKLRKQSGDSHLVGRSMTSGNQALILG